MARYPGAKWRPVQNYSGPMTAHLGLILHVQQGNNSPYGWFNDHTSEASSHFWVSKSGAVEQFVDSGLRAWAQAQGNATYNSVETEGFATEALTSAQLDSLAELYRWGTETHGWRLLLAETPGQAGFGWHGMGGAAWGGHTGCAGPLRDPQRATVLAQLTGDDDDMTPEQAQMLQQVHDALYTDPKAFGLTPMWATLSSVARDVAEIKERVASMHAGNYGEKAGFAGGDLAWLDKRLNGVIEKLTPKKTTAKAAAKQAKG
jgi:hypothetical protein